MTPKQEQDEEEVSMIPRKRIRLSICPSPSSTSPSSASGGGGGDNTAADRRNVRVVARVRPLSAIEKDTKVIITAATPTTSSSSATTTAPSIVVGDPTAATAGSAGGDTTTTRCYEYDAVFGPDSTQESVYKESGAMYAVRNDILQGFNCTILAYGQTGSGKTFTMGTTTTTTTTTGSSSSSSNSSNCGGNTIHEMDGIIPRAVYDLFDQSTKLVESDGTKTVDVDMSYLEIYNEEARDLLLSSSSQSSDGGCSSAQSNLYIREGPNGEVHVQNLTWEKVTSHSHVGTFMDNASRRRVVASTQMNAVSSRSHAICTLRVTVTDASKNNQKSVSKLTLVDLAGSERVKRTKAEGNRLKEGININKGLFTLGQVVSCLSEIGQSASTSTTSAHVPYRDSKLTRLLQDSLGGNSRTIMVACVSPADSNVEESTNTLRYASRARNIKNTATRNLIEAQNMPPEVAAALRNENLALRQRVIQLEAQMRESVSTGTTGSRTTASTTTATSSLSSSLVSPLSATNEETGTFSSSNLVTNLRCQIVALQTRVDNLQDQASRLVQDSLQASLSADKFRLQLEEVLDIAKRNGLVIQIPTISKLDKDSSSSTSSTIALVEELRKEIEAYKTREQEARVDAEVARATAASVIAENGNLTAVHDAILTSNRDVENQEDIDNDTDESLLTAELLSVNGNIEKKEEIVRQAIMEKQCLEAMKSKFEGALQSLQVEIETLLVLIGLGLEITDSFF